MGLGASISNGGVHRGISYKVGGDFKSTLVTINLVYK